MGSIDLQILQIILKIEHILNPHTHYTDCFLFLLPSKSIKLSSHAAWRLVQWFERKLGAIYFVISVVVLQLKRFIILIHVTIVPLKVQPIKR